mmetsp:Transcript_83832/g.242133  ORF Transcript_83832/g.242133 Transcript_83832/m.242133 type:complete len:472 (-) Transcript_83832:159-1574(-)
MFRVSLVAATCCLVSQVWAHGEGGEHPWEWAGVFELTGAERYTWSATRGAAGAYADPDMKVVIVPLGDHGHLDDAEPTAEAAFRDTATVWRTLHSGDSVPLATTGADTIGLHFDETTWISLFHFRPSATGYFAVFTAHVPSEFENGFHFLKDEHGDDVEAHDEEHMDDEAAAVEEKAEGVGVAMGAAAITALPTILVLPFVAPFVDRLGSGYFPVMNSFASGAIFAAAVFLLLPESIHMVGAGLDESAGHAVWGSAVMCGWLIGILVHHIGDMVHEKASSARGSDAIEDKVQGEGGKVDVAVAAAVTFGDFWHNFVDGMVIGFSARACSSSTLWATVAASVAHETPQEIADYIVLITKANLNWRMALGLNLFAALSTVVGAAIGHGVDVSDNVQGIFLAMGAGVYLFVAVTELAPSILEIRTPMVMSSMTRLLVFAIGATLIGLVLLSDSHCDGMSDGDAAAGDAHAGHVH